VNVKDSESSITKESVVAKNVTVADSVKEESENENSKETMLAKVEKDKNSVIDEETKISDGTRTNDSAIQ